MAKHNIENIEVHIGSSSPVISWQIGKDRYHVFLDGNNEWEETVFKNSAAKYNEPGHYSTRRLDRVSSKATSSMFAEVLAVVERDNLLAEAEAKHTAEVTQRRRRIELEDERHRLEQEALTYWRQGAFDAATDLHGRYCDVLSKLAEVDDA